LKYYGIKNQKSDVGIFSDTSMSAILDYKNSAIYNVADRKKVNFDPLGSGNPLTDLDET